MIQIGKPRLWAIFSATLLAMTLVGGLTGGLRLHAASLQQYMTELGLAEFLAIVPPWRSASQTLKGRW